MDSRREKVIFLGDPGVGKTSIIRRRAQGTFAFQMLPTIGSAHEIVEVELQSETIELCIWDTAGQEQFKALVPLYMRNSRVAVIVASLVDHLSIDNLQKWYSKLSQNGESPEVIVVVNKTDLQMGNQDALDALRRRLMDDFRVVMLVSARSGEGVDELFHAIALACANDAKPVPAGAGKEMKRPLELKPTECQTGEESHWCGC